MKALIFSLILLSNLFSMEDPKILMDSISQHAIRFGDGPNKVYAFVDPLCPNSQHYISVISKSKDLHRMNAYYIFLYKLPMFNSAELIQYIYQSEEPERTLKWAMLHQDYEVPFEFEASESTQNKIKEIANIGKEMQIKRRPYLLIYTEGSKYCRVSEGTPPCLEDNDFD